MNFLGLLGQARRQALAPRAALMAGFAFCALAAMSVSFVSIANAQDAQAATPPTVATNPHDRPLSGSFIVSFADGPAEDGFSVSGFTPDDGKVRNVWSPDAVSHDPLGGAVSHGRDRIFGQPHLRQGFRQRATGRRVRRAQPVFPPRSRGNRRWGSERRYEPRRPTGPHLEARRPQEGARDLGVLRGLRAGGQDRGPHPGRRPDHYG